MSTEIPQDPFNSLSSLPEFFEEIPKESNTSDPDYNAFLDPESPYYGLSPNWSRTSQRPFPTMRCSAIKKDGTQCRNRGMRGTGLNGTSPQCRKHGANLPNVAKHAQAVVEAARLQITDSVPDAIRVVQELMMNAKTGEAVRLKAATELLDRANVKGTIDISVEVTNNILPSEKIMKKLQAMRTDKDEEPLLEDLGEAIVEEPEQGK